MLLAKANGINNVEALLRASAAMETTIGIIKATVPVLLTKAPIVAVTTTTSKNKAVSLSPARRIILRLKALANPVCNIPPPTTNKPAIMITIRQRCSAA